MYPRDAWLLTLPLIVISVFNATMARGVAGPWAWQFAAFQTPAIAFLAAVWGLRFRTGESAAGANRQFGNLFLGVLGFALVTSLIRTGAYALELVPTLYGVPLALTAMAYVHGARWISAYEPGPRLVALLRLGGFALAALAFALALARPLAPSPLFNGNTLAVAVIGLFLFVDSLRAERHPAYLYMGFAAFFLAYFEARQALGYASWLPGPYRSLNGLFFNTLLGSLAIAFARRWQDGRLARHCHHIGVPLSLAACAYSSLDARAAFDCMSGYAVLYLLASWVFAAPLVQYLAIAAMAGAAYFGSTLLPSVTLEQQALLAAGMGLGCSVVLLVLRGFRERAVPASLGAWQPRAIYRCDSERDDRDGSGWHPLVPRRMGLPWCESGRGGAESRQEGGGDRLPRAVLRQHGRSAGDRDRLTSRAMGPAAGAGPVRDPGGSGRAGGDQLGSGTGPRSPGSGFARHRDLLHLAPATLRALAGGSGGRALCRGAVRSDGGLELEREPPAQLGDRSGASASAFAVGSAAVYRAELLAHVTVWAALAAYFCGVLGMLFLTGVPNIGATTEIALAAGSLLVFAIWDRLRLSYYRRPLLYAALALVAIVEPLALFIWQPAGHVSLALALCGLAHGCPHRGNAHGRAGPFFFDRIPGRLAARLRCGALPGDTILVGIGLHVVQPDLARDRGTSDRDAR